MPRSEEAEKAILGCMMLDMQRTFDVCIERGVTDQSFWLPAHKVIFQEIMDMINKGKAVDVTTVASSLKAKSLIDRVGGDTYLCELVDAVGTTAHLEYYAVELKERHLRREIIEKAKEMAEQAFDDYEIDSRTLLDQRLTEIFHIAQVTHSSKTNKEAIDSKFEEWEQALNGNIPGLPCFLDDVAQDLGFFRFGKPYFIGASPGMGKSTWVSNQFSYWAVDHNIPVAIASLEMEHEEWLGRAIAERADVSSFSLDTGWDRDCRGGWRLEKVQEAKQIFVDDKGQMKVPMYISERNMNVDEFCMWARLMVHKYGVQAIALDYIQILETPKDFKGNEKEYLTQAANKIRALAKELKIVIIIASQLSGDGADGGRPNPKNLFGARALQQAAYGIIMLYMEDDQTYVDIQKNRGGLTGRSAVTFQKNRQRWLTTGEDNIDNIKPASKDSEWSGDSGRVEGRKQFVQGVGEVEYGLSSDEDGLF